MVVVVLCYAAIKPDTFRIERALHIKAPPEKVFALINDFSQWAYWSPWEKKDPSMKRERSGPANGVGSTYGWEGNKNVGSGRMEILQSTPSSQLQIKLDFLKPFEAHNTAEFTLKPQEGGTLVTWAMFGPQVFLGKVMSLFFSMEKMVGPDFEAGLAAMKARAES